MAEALPDVEGAVRTLLRADAALVAVVGQRVFFGVPKGAVEATFPLITVSRVGGGDDAGDAPLDVAMVQLDCWGGIDGSGNGRKAEATALVNTLRSTLRAVNGTQVGTVTLFGVNVESVVWLPDPNSDRPRYVVTAEVAAIVT